MKNKDNSQSRAFKYLSLFGIGGIISAILAYFLPFIYSINDPPIAVITASKNSGLVPFEVTFDAFKSKDPESKHLKYKWYIGVGDDSILISKRDNFTHEFKNPGEHLIQLEVTDHKQLKSKDSLYIKAKNSNDVKSISRSEKKNEIRTNQPLAEPDDNEPTNEIIQAEKKVYLILPTKDISLGHSMSNKILDYVDTKLYTALSRIDSISIVNRKDVDVIVREIIASHETLSDPKTKLNIGKRIGANRIISPKIMIDEGIEVASAYLSEPFKTSTPRVSIVLRITDIEHSLYENVLNGLAEGEKVPFGTHNTNSVITGLIEEAISKVAKDMTLL